MFSSCKVFSGTRQSGLNSVITFKGRMCTKAAYPGSFSRICILSISANATLERNIGAEDGILDL